MNVFISHSSNDKVLLANLSAILKKWGYNPLCAEYCLVPDTITNKVANLLEIADFCVLVFTKQGYDSKFVNQEVGYVYKSGKPIFVLKEDGFDLDGFIYGYDSITLNIKESTNILPLKKALDNYSREIGKKGFVMHTLVATALGFGLSLWFNNNKS